MSDRPPSHGSPLALHALVAAGLVALTIVAFIPALNAEFLRYDDQILITDNPAYRGFAAENLRFMFTAKTLGHYQPLTWLSYAADYAMWGMNAKGYHLTNVLLHAVNAVLVYMLTLRLFGIAARSSKPTQEPRKANTGAPGVVAIVSAAVAAALFAVHPLRVESVAWVTERRDVLSAAFLLGAALLYVRSVNLDRPGLRSVPLYLGCIGLLTLSLLSKAWGMSFFVLMLVVDWYPLGRLRPSTWVKDALSLVVEKIPMIVLGLAAAAMAGTAQNEALAAKTIEEWGVSERVVQAFYGLAFYMRKTVAPFDLSPLYQLPIDLNPFEPRYVAAYAIVLSAVIAALALARRVPALLAAGLIYGVCVAPVLGVFQSGDQFVADRYSYLACIPFAMLIGAGGMWAAKQQARLKPVLVAAAAIVTVGLCVLTYRQSEHWRDTEALWRQAAAAEPSAIGLTNLGLELDYQKKPVEAIKAYVEAVQLDETDGRAWYAMGNALRNIKQYEHAENAYKEAIAHMPQAYVPLVNLGTMYLNDLDRPADAVEMYRRAIADVEKGGRRPLSGLAYVALGHALGNMGDYKASREALNKALDFPDSRAEAQEKLRILNEVENKP